MSVSSDPEQVLGVQILYFYVVFEKCPYFLLFIRAAHGRITFLAAGDQVNIAGAGRLDYLRIVSSQDYLFSAGCVLHHLYHPGDKGGMNVALGLLYYDERFVLKIQGHYYIYQVYRAIGNERGRHEPAGVIEFLQLHNQGFIGKVFYFQIPEEGQQVAQQVGEFSFALRVFQDVLQGYRQVAAVLFQLYLGARDNRPLRQLGIEVVNGDPVKEPFEAVKKGKESR